MFKHLKVQLKLSNTKISSIIVKFIKQGLTKGHATKSI